MLRTFGWVNWEHSMKESVDGLLMYHSELTKVNKCTYYNMQTAIRFADLIIQIVKSVAFDL